MNPRFTACAFALVSALVVLGFSGNVTTAAPPRGGAVDSLALPTAAATLAAPQSIALVADPEELRTEVSDPEGNPANIKNSTGSMEDFMVFVITDVDAYWSDVWEEEGESEPQVSYAFPAAGESVTSQCGTSDDLSAYYCTVADEIVVSQSFANRVWEGTIAANTDGDMQYETGDFSVAYVIAHEFAHSLQAELGILLAEGQVYPTVRTELHADCWAGVWANDADYEGILDDGDIEEALQTALDMGDYAIDDPLHHGTPAQRSDAFMTGYDSGDPDDCESYLLGE